MTPRSPFPPHQWQHHIDAAQAWLLQHERLKQLTQLCQEAGYELAIFGGAIRDLLLFGQLSNDIDCIVSSPEATYDEFAFIAWGKQVSETLGMDWMSDERPHHWAAYDERTQFALDVAWCHDMTVFLKQTDYSMNGIAFHMQAEQWLDPNDGRTDLSQRRLIIPPDRQPLYCDPVNRWTRLFLLMVHTNSQPTPELLDWLMAHRDELTHMSTQNPVGNLLKLFRALSYPGWGAHYITDVWAKTGFLSVLFIELSPWLDTLQGLSTVLNSWARTTVEWDTLTSEQKAWLQQLYPEDSGSTMLGMLRLAMVIRPVFTQLALPEGLTPSDITLRLTGMIERLGIRTEPFPTLLTQAITFCAVATPQHPVSQDWLSRNSTAFMQDYHHSLCELLATY